MIKSFDSIVAVWDDHREARQLLNTLEIFGNTEVSSALHRVESRKLKDLEIFGLNTSSIKISCPI